jgi:hypothetical protein
MGVYFKVDKLGKLKPKIPKNKNKIKIRRDNKLYNIIKKKDL